MHPRFVRNDKRGRLPPSPVTTPCHFERSAPRLRRLCRQEAKTRNLLARTPTLSASCFYCHPQRFPHLRFRQTNGSSCIRASFERTKKKRIPPFACHSPLVISSEALRDFGAYVSRKRRREIS